TRPWARPRRRSTNTRSSTARTSASATSPTRSTPSTPRPIDGGGSPRDFRSRRDSVGGIFFALGQPQRRAHQHETRDQPDQPVGGGSLAEKEQRARHGQRDLQVVEHRERA